MTLVLIFINLAILGAVFAAGGSVAILATLLVQAITSIAVVRIMQ
jgi:hypothetical protein